MLGVDSLFAWSRTSMTSLTSLTSHEIVICGAGLAGLSLGRQLLLARPDLDLLVLDKDRAEVAVATHKVGESSVEGGTYYFNEVLELAEYNNAVHLPKLGLRFFGGSTSRFSERFELGAFDFPPIPSVQFDRGVLERDLRALLRSMNAKLHFEARVVDVELRGRGPHIVRYQVGDELREVEADWVIDATGRRRLLQSKLGLGKPSPHRASACWWRVEGRLDLGRLVPGSPEWSARTRHDRWLSTNHLLGNGYWVWLIPLCSNNTSVGIVTDEAIHPIRTRARLDDAQAWLATHEPELAALLSDHSVLDFKALKHFSHWTERAFSFDRWACVGEAAAFVDPLYSTGSDLIAWANTLVTRLILDDRRGALTSAQVELADAGFRELVEGTTQWFVDSYSVLGNDRVALLKILWDGISYFSFMGRSLLHGVPENFELLGRYRGVYARYCSLDRAVQQLFRDWFRCWAKHGGPGPIAAGLYHPLVCPSVRPCALSERERERQPPAEFLAEQEQRLARMEDIARALFVLAIEQLCPVEAATVATRAIDPRVMQVGEDGSVASGFAGERSAPATICDELRRFLSPIDPRSSQRVPQV